MLTRRLTRNIQSINMYFLCYMYYILHSYNRASQRKENVIKEIIRKRKYIYSTLCICWKKSRVSLSGPVWFKLYCSRVSYILQYQAHPDTFRSNFICGKNVGVTLKEISPQSQRPVPVNKLIPPYSSQILHAMYILYSNHSEPIIWGVESFIYYYVINYFSCCHIILITI